jgi:hypothetical protein
LVASKKSTEIIEQQPDTEVEDYQLAFSELKRLESDKNWGYFIRPCGKRTQSFAEMLSKQCSGQ